MHAIFADKADHGIEGRHQYDQRRNDTGDETNEHLPALLEHADEVLADSGQPA